MKLWKYKNQNLKILGLSILKIKYSSKGVYLYVLGAPVWRMKGRSVILNFKRSNNFDTRLNDGVIADIARTVHLENKQKKPNRVAFLATELYDNGGHTKCLRDLVNSLHGIYEEKLFLTKKAKNVCSVSELSSLIEVKDFELSFCMKRDIFKIAKEIMAFAPETVMVYIHPDDMVGAGVLSVLKRAGVKIIFFNHASHYPSLGMSFADVILEGMLTTERVTHEKRHLKNTHIIGLQSLKKEGTAYHSAEELNALKKQIGIPADALVTMSGGAGYKFFESDSSPYFDMIKRLLLKEPRLYHVVMSAFSPKEQGMIDAVFDEAPLKKRLIIIPFQKDFDKYFQLADVFVDSFPVSSALTQIDLMRNKVASVVKINTDTPMFSFHEYQMPDYPYMFENVADMEAGILELLHDKQKRAEIINRNYEFWLKTYESDIVRDKYIKIIEGVKNDLFNFEP